MFENMSDIVLNQNYRIFIDFSLFCPWASLFLFSLFKIINSSYKKEKRKKDVKMKGKHYGHIWRPSSVP